MQLDLKNKKIWVAGHNGMVGRAIMNTLSEEGYTLQTVSKQELDLRRQADVESWMSQNRPDIVITAAAKVGGIGANSAAPAEFLYDNLMIEANIIHAAHVCDVQNLLFLGSSCIYPKFAQQPIQEEALLSGHLEPTNEGYAVAKIAGIKLCQMYQQQYGRNYISAMPCNLYGPGDRYDAQISHVIPAMILKYHKAKELNEAKVEFWGTGQPMREFLYVDDLAEGVVHLLKTYKGNMPINIGSGQEVSIKELSELVADVVGYKGETKFDSSKPDGTPRKIMDNQRILGLGWQPKIDLKTGLIKAYKDFLGGVHNRDAA